MDNALKDAINLKWTFLTLMTNQSATSMNAGRLVDSVVEAIEEVFFHISQCFILHFCVFAFY